MAKPIIQIDSDDFEVGISSKQTNGKGFFKLVGIDITKEDGAMELAKKIVTSFPTGEEYFQGAVDNFESFVAKNNPYIDDTLPYAVARGNPNDPKLLKLNQGGFLKLNQGGLLKLNSSGSGPTVWINPSTSISWLKLAEDTATSDDGRCDIFSYNTKLYWISDGTRVNLSTDGVNWTFNHHTISTAITGKGAEFNGDFFIPHGNKLAKIDVSDIYTDDAFILPTELTITSVEPSGKYLAIGTAVLDNSGSPIKRSAKVYFWDGSSERAADIVDANTDGCWGLKDVDNILYLLGGKDGSLYFYNGSDFEIVRQIRKGSSDINIDDAMEVVDSDLLFGVAGDAKPVGVYSWGKLKRSGSRRTMSMPYDIEGGANPWNSRIYAIKTLRWDSSGFNGRYVYVSVSYLNEEGGDVINEVWIVQSDIADRTNEAYIITERYSAQKDFSSLFKGLQILNRSYNFPDITVYYRYDDRIDSQDDEAGWIKLGKASKRSRPRNKTLRGIQKRVQEMQFKIVIKGVGQIRTTPEITGINIY